MERSNSASTPKTALITGGSGGIGFQLAKIFAGEGHNLALVARDKDRLKAAAEEITSISQVNIRIIPKDLSVPGAAESLTAELDANSIFIDYLVNNAGFGILGPFSEIRPNEQTALLNLNILSLTILTKLITDRMVSRGGGGGIMNLASTAAFLPGPNMATYYASKAYVLRFSEALAVELKGRGITVTALCPGPVDTGFAERAGTDKAAISRLGAMSAERAAIIGYKAMMKGKRVMVPGLLHKLLIFPYRIAPSHLSALVVRNLHKKR